MGGALNVLVTGGAGFIGSEFVHQLVEQNEHTVTVIDAFTYAGNENNLSDVIGQIKIIEANISNEKLVRQIFNRNRFNLVVHFAAESHVDKSIISPKKFIVSNVDGTFNLLEAMNKEQVEKFIYVSTDEVYGSLESVIADEHSVLAPSSPYSASKASGEHLTHAYGKTFGLNYKIVRCSNNYGKRQYPEKLIPLTIKKFIQNKRVPIYGTGNNIREWLHVSDCAQAIALVAFQESENHIFNIGSGDYHTNLSVVSQIAEHMGIDYDFIEFVSDRKGHDFRYAINSDLIRKTFSWEPRITFSEGIKLTIDWYLNQVNFLNGLKK